MIESEAEPITSQEFSGNQIALERQTSVMFNALALAIVTLAAALPVLVALYWISVSAEAIHRDAGLMMAAPSDLSLLNRLPLVAVGLAAVAPLAWGLFGLGTCFSEFGKGRPFSVCSTRGLRNFAAGTLMAVLAQTVAFSLIRLLLTWDAPEGSKQFAISIDSVSLLMVLFAATITTLAWGMEHAAAIAEENRQFV